MFKNPGRRIKRITAIVFTIISIAYIVGAFFISWCVKDFEYSLLVFCVAILAGPFLAYLQALLLYAFGELVENSTKLAEKNKGTSCDIM